MRESDNWNSIENLEPTDIAGHHANAVIFQDLSPTKCP